MAWDDGDAFLHYDPDLEGRVDQPQYITKDQAAPKSSDPRQKCKNATCSKATKNKHRATNDGSAPLDQEWEEVVEAKIVEDQELHFRILRYEVSLSAPSWTWSLYIYLANTFRFIPSKSI